MITSPAKWRPLNGLDEVIGIGFPPYQTCVRPFATDPARVFPHTAEQPACSGCRPQGEFARKPLHQPPLDRSTEPILLKIELMLFDTPGMIAPAATATNPR